MAMPASRTVPSSPNPSTQGSPRTRNWSSLRTAEPGSAFRGISGRGSGRGRGGRGGGRGGGVRSSRGGGHPPNNSVQKGGSLPESANSTPSPSPNVSTVPRKPPVLPSITISNKSVNGVTERGDRLKPGSRKQPRATTPSPSETSKTAPPTPSRSAHLRRRAQQGKDASTTAKPPFSTAPTVVKSQKSRSGSTPASQTILRKDIPPHLAAAHEAEIRHDIDALVERVRAVAMAENRPTTPGSHIDWARDEDDSLPDLDDWGITTTHTNIANDEDESEEISPILTDTLRPLPEPNSDVHENEREMETYDAQPERVDDSPTQPSSLPSPMESAAIVSEGAPEQGIIEPTAAEESSSPTLPNGKLPSHPFLPGKPVAAVESLYVRDGSITKVSGYLAKPPTPVTEDDSFMNKSEGLAESIHAPPADELLNLERVSSASSSDRGLAVSIHAPAPGFPESHSAPSLLTGNSSSAVPRTHSRSQTEGRHQPHTAPPGTVSHRHGRSGAISPLGQHVYTHSRNRSTPAGGSRAPHAARPVITGDAISRLARTIGGLAPVPRTQTIPVTKDSTISS